MKIIAIQLDGYHSATEPTDDAHYLEAYIDLNEVLERDDARLLLAKDTYAGNMTYNAGWIVEGRTPRLVTTPTACDLIYIKKSAFKPDAGATVLNHPEMTDLCNDKLKTVSVFPQLSPVTKIIQSKEEMASAFDAVPGDTVVIKPLSAYGGDGVFIGNRQEAMEKISTFPYLVQEFIDTSAGIPDITDTYHDLRLIVMDGLVTHFFYRTPRPGSKISNVALGGWMTPLVPGQEPPEALAICAEIDRYMERYGHRIYCVDCARHKDGTWKLIELNAPPGQKTRLEMGLAADLYLETHADVLLAACR